MEPWASFFFLSRAPSTTGSRNFSWQAVKALWGSITAHVTVKPSAETNANGILFGEVAHPAYSEEDEEAFSFPPLTAKECITPPAAPLYAQVPSLDGYLHLHLHLRQSYPERLTMRALVDEAWIPQMATVQISSRKETVGDTPVIPERACQRKVLCLKKKEKKKQQETDGWVCFRWWWITWLSGFRGWMNELEPVFHLKTGLFVLNVASRAVFSLVIYC